MSAPIATARDDFQDGIRAELWDAATSSGSATYTEASGQVQFILPSSIAGSHSIAYATDLTYDLTGDGCFINIVQMLSTSVVANAFFDVFIDGSNDLRWIQSNNTLKAQTFIAGVATDRYSATWSGTTYKYLRIRESGGSIFFDSSTNGTSWTNRFTMANPFAMTDLYIQIGASCGNVASPGTFKIEDFNVILPALTTNWRWTQVVWSLFERSETITLALDAAGTAQAYVVTADGVDASNNPSGSVRYWSGPARGGRELTEQTTQAAAQAMAVNIPVDGRFDLPTMVEARCFRVYHRSIDGSSYTVRELYPRRLVESDDIRAESILTLHLAAGAVTADKLFVRELSAITANIGFLTITDVNGDPGWIYQGSGTGDSPTTGLKIFNVGGVGKLSTYNTGVEQVTLDTDGKLKWGGGVGIMDAVSGITIEVLTQTSNPGVSKYGMRWDVSGTNKAAIMAYNHSSGGGQLYLSTNGGTGGTIYMQSSVQISGSGGLYVSGGGTILQETTVQRWLNVGTSTAASSNGQIATQYDDASTTSVPTILYLEHTSSATPATGFGADFRMRLKSSTTVGREAVLIRGLWRTATDASRKAGVEFYVYDTSPREALRIETNGSAPMIGVLGANAQGRLTVSGVRTGTLAQLQAVVASFLTAIANFGFITDSTT